MAENPQSTGVNEEFSDERNEENGVFAQRLINREVEEHMKRISIRNRLLLTGIGIFLILLSIGIINNNYIRESIKTQKVLNAIEKLAKHELVLQKLRKEFVLTETINPEFFETSESAIVDSFKYHVDEAIALVALLSDSTFDLGHDDKLALIAASLKEYEINFAKLVKITETKGFKDYGMVGEMRDLIHEVETSVKQQNDMHLAYFMLMLRRHEKDYLLRKDLKYKEKFSATHQQFLAILKSDKYLGKQETKQLIELLGDYKNQFFAVIEADIYIGLSKNKGLVSELVKNSAVISQRIQALGNNVVQKSTREMNKARMILLISTVVLSIGVIVILLTVSNYIVKAIGKLGDYITSLGKGELPDEMEVKTKDEIASMIKSINILVKNLKNTRDFAVEVGNGNLETNINVFDNKGALGGSLIEMRKKLLEVAREREANALEVKRRSWINEGVARVNDILRKQSNDIQELNYQVIKTLVKYLGANQGGIYLLDEGNGEEKYFKLESAYAYDRKRMVKQSFKMGDGLVGACAYEQETIYLPSVPDSFVNITSGLGDAPPNCVLLVPVKLEDNVQGVMEIASFNQFEQHQVELVERAALNYASTIISAKMNARTSKLLEQSKFQAEELQAQEEELRQNMEELQATQETMNRREQEMKAEIELLKREINRLECDHENPGENGNRDKFKNSLALLNTLTESILIAELTLDGTFIIVNQRYLDTFGFTPKEIIGKSYLDFIPVEEREHTVSILESVKNGKIEKVLCKREMANKIQSWLKISFAPIKEKGEITKVLMFGKNINYLQEEANFKDLTSQKDLEIMTVNVKKQLEFLMDFKGNGKKKLPDSILG